LNDGAAAIIIDAQQLSANMVSSSAKADDPVRRDVSIPVQVGDYWIPAFAV
jgi:hypothetical protein